MGFCEEKNNEGMCVFCNCYAWGCGREKQEKCIEKNGHPCYPCHVEKESDNVLKEYQI